MSIFVTATPQMFTEGLQFGPNNEVISVSAGDPFGKAGVVRGMILMSINGFIVEKAEEEQKKMWDKTGKLMLAFTEKPPGYRDEFDLSSCEEEDASILHHNVPIALPSDENGLTRMKSTDVLADAAEKTKPGRCIIIMSEGVNPAYAIAVTAERASRTVMYINTLARLKARQSLNQAGEVFCKSLQKGVWIYIEQATKSISLLQKLAECILECQAGAKIHSNARVFLMCEPHPHFPEELLVGGVTLRGTLSQDSGQVELENDLLESRKGLSFVLGTRLSSVDVTPEVTRGRRRVKISNEVNIVPLEKNTFMELSQGAFAADLEPTAGDGLTRVAKYVFGGNEKFISLCKIKEGRYAVGTTGGYVLILDRDGLPLIQFRPHKACVWDVAFPSTYDFATASEDGTSSIFNYTLSGQELLATSVASFQSDVFAVTYVVSEDPESAVLSGGLSGTICVLHSDRQNSSFISATTSIQAMNSTKRKHVLIGGGNGRCLLVDSATCTILEVTERHKKKVPAVASFNDTAVTGGFDRMLRLWDVRSGFRMLNEKLLPEVITAVSVHGKYFAACSGSDLFVWDARKHAVPLATKTKAWMELTRGLVIDEDIVVSASADGVTRFWSLGSISGV